MSKYFLFALLSFLEVAAHGGDEQVSSYRTMSVGGNLNDGKKFNANIELKDFDCEPKEQQDLVFWGTDGYCPATVIRNIQFCVGDNKITFPESAYRDLADVSLPLGFYVMQSANEVKLYVRGGDGVASYTAIFVIASGRLKSRLIEYMDGEGNLATDVKSYNE